MDHNKKVVELPIEDVLPNRFQPRIKFNEESIIELSESIKEHGVIQPIVVRPVGDKYEIIAGERRYKASTMAGLATIPAIVTNFNDKESAEVALIENVQRKDLTPIEEAISYKKILDMGYLTQEQLAIKLGKTQSTVANKLRLLNLDEDVQEALLEDKISERHARSLLKLNDFNKQKELLKRIIEERLTVRKTDEEINKMLNGTYEPTIVEPKEKLVTEVIQNVDTQPFDFSEPKANIDNESFDSKEFNIPKFEDLFVVESSNEEKMSSELDQEYQIQPFDSINLELPEEAKSDTDLYNPQFIVPKFDNSVEEKETENNTKSEIPSDFNPEFIVPKFDEFGESATINNIQSDEKVDELYNPKFIIPTFEESAIETAQASNIGLENEIKDELNLELSEEKNDNLILVENPLEISNEEHLQNEYNSEITIPKFDDSEQNIVKNNDNTEISEDVDINPFEEIFVDDKNLYNLDFEEEKATVFPFNFSDIEEPQNFESPKTEIVTHNTYVANNMKAIINTVHNCADTIRKYGFSVNVDESESPEEYKITFVINK